MSTTKELVQRESTDKVQRLSELPTIVPPVDIFENDEEILVVADFPGVDTDHIDVRLEGGQIDIEGRQSPPNEQAPALTPVMYARSFRVPASTSRRAKRPSRAGSRSARADRPAPRRPEARSYSTSTE
jgi:HSP20 family protein